MFFIVGSARSGTTLLRLMLNAHPHVAVPPESRFITELWANKDDVEIDEFLRALDGHRLFRAWDLPLEAVRSEIGAVDHAPYREVVLGVYRAYARSAGKTIYGDKTPRYVEHLTLLRRLFPDARFVHLVRDGRNVAMSYADVPFGPKTVAKAAALWRDRVGKGIQAGRDLGQGRYLELRYEDLVEDPTGEVKTLCEFLDIEFDPAMLDYTEQARDSMLTRAARYNPHLSETPTVNVRTWQETMPSRHVEVFEAIAGNVLAELEYERRYPQPGPGVRVEAALGRLGLPLNRLRGSRA